MDTWLKSAMNQVCPQSTTACLHVHACAVRRCHSVLVLQVMEELENERWANYTSHDPSLSVRAASSRVGRPHTRQNVRPITSKPPEVHRSKSRRGHASSKRTSWLTRAVALSSLVFVCHLIYSQRLSHMAAVAMTTSHTGEMAVSLETQECRSRLS